MSEPPRRPPWATTALAALAEQVLAVPPQYLPSADELLRLVPNSPQLALALKTAIEKARRDSRAHCTVRAADGLRSSLRLVRAVRLDRLVQLEAGTIVVVVEDAGPSVNILNRASKRYRLTERETQVLGLLVERRTNREVARELGISESTARHHVERVRQKLGVANRRDISRALDEGTTG